MRPLKIIQCCVFYLPVRVGGIEIYIYSLSNELKKAGHDVKILVPEYPNEEKYPAEYGNIPIITYPEFLNKTKKEFEGTVPGKGLPGFIRSIEREKPDLIHFHQISNSNGMSIFHFAEVKKLGIPLVFTIHLQGWETRSLIKRLSELADRIILLSDWYYKYLTTKFNITKRISIIKSGLQNVEKHKKIPRPQSPVLRLVYVGRISPEKGLHILLSALKNMDEKLVSLSIFGGPADDKYHNKCLQLCKQKSNIKWCGHVDNKEVLKTISMHDFLVLPSIVPEMSPLIILEAFAAGVPVIGSDSGGIAEAITPGTNGFLFEMGKSKSLKKLLQTIIESPEQVKSQIFHFPAIRHFKQIAHEVEEQYYSVLGI